MTSSDTVVLSDEVAEAQHRGLPIVALESTIFSELGLPAPANAEALRRCLAAVRSAGAVPAVTAVLDGRARVGVDEADHHRICGPATKTAQRDLPVAIATGVEYGATTVSAAVSLAAQAGVSVFATGGIGGVHRGVDMTGDVSADLLAIGHHPVVTVCAGAKAFLDLARTLEYLETIGVPVLGWQHDDFPAFYVRSSGLRVPHRVETSEQVARIHRMCARSGSGSLLTVPIPLADELDPQRLTTAVESAVADADAEGILGAAVTPFVLARIAAATDGDSIPANLALAENNARVAADVAVAIAGLSAD